MIASKEMVAQQYKEESQKMIDIAQRFQSGDISRVDFLDIRDEFRAQYKKLAFLKKEYIKACKRG